MLATIEAKIVAAFAIVGLAAILLGAGYLYGMKVKGAKDALEMAQLRQAMSDAVSNAKTENDALKTQLQEKKDEESKVVDFLANSHPSSGLQLPAGSCSSKTKPPTGSIPAPAGTGTLPVDPQVAFGEFTKGLDKLALEADQLTAQCRVLSDWAKSQVK